MVKEPVEEADGGGVLGEEAAPLPEGPVGSNAEGSSFVGRGDEAEDRCGFLDGEHLGWGVGVDGGGHQ